MRIKDMIELFVIKILDFQERCGLYRTCHALYILIVVVKIKSILQVKRECYICAKQGKTNTRVELHHIFGGNAPMKRKSEVYGFLVFLCPEHHRGQTGVHTVYKTNAMIKAEAQREFEKTHTREDFMKIIKRSYL